MDEIPADIMKIARMYSIGWARAYDPSTAEVQAIAELVALAIIGERNRSANRIEALEQQLREERAAGLAAPAKEG